MFSNGMSLSDIKAVTEDNGLGGGNGIIWLILILLILGGGNGWNNGGYANGNALQTDFATLERKMDTLASGISSGFADSTYALNNAVTGGFASAQNTMTQGFAGLNTALRDGFSQGAINTLNGVNAVQASVNGVANAVQSCCCTTNNNITTSSRDIIDSANANTQKILDAIQQNEIQSLRDKLQDARFELSQQYQNSYLVNTLNPCAKPAYLVASPTPINYGCGCACGA